MFLKILYLHAVAKGDQALAYFKTKMLYKNIFYNTKKILPYNLKNFFVDPDGTLQIYLYQSRNYLNVINYFSAVPQSNIIEFYWKQTLYATQNLIDLLD